MKDHSVFKQLLRIKVSIIGINSKSIVTVFTLLLCTAPPLGGYLFAAPQTQPSAATEQLETTMTSIVEPSAEGLITALIKAAESGSGEAALALGNRYFHGTAVERDRSEAVKWWESGMNLDSAEAAYNLGVAYVNGYGVNKDLSKAQDAFAISADKGFSKAHLALGIVYLHFAQNDSELREAGEQFRKAAESGDPIAKNNLALMYEQGIGYPSDEDAATYWREFSPQSATISNDAEVSQHTKSVAWINARNPDNFTLQLASGDTFSATEKLIAEVSLERAVFAKIFIDSERFVAIAGDFSSYSLASEALESLPSTIRANSPFIVKFGVVQRQIDEHTKFNN